MSESIFLEGLTGNYRKVDTNTSYDHFRQDVCASVCGKFVSKETGEILELGCAFGDSTMRLAKLAKHVVCVEGASEFIDEARKRVNSSNVTFCNSCFEDLQYDKEFDLVVASSILEHVVNPIEILNICHRALKDNGYLLITVPNAEAFSRQLAVEMKLMGSIYDLTENDLNYGHRRVYDLQSLTDTASKAGFEIVESGGLFIKPFADFQMRNIIDSGIIGDEQMQGLVAMAKRYPRLSGQIYAVGVKN